MDKINITIAGIILFVFSFPFWCAFITRKFSKNLSDEAIIRLPIWIGIFLMLLGEVSSYLEKQHNHPWYTIFISLVVWIFFSQALAKAGILLANKKSQPGNREVRETPAENLTE